MVSPCCLSADLSIRLGCISRSISQHTVGVYLFPEASRYRRAALQFRGQQCHSDMLILTIRLWLQEEPCSVTQQCLNFGGGNDNCHEIAGMTALVQPVQVVVVTPCFDGEISSILLFFKYGGRVLRANLHTSVHFLEEKAGWSEQPVETTPGTALG